MESLLSHAGYGALAILGFLEACCIPIPSEITFGFAGVLAYQGHLNVVLVIVIGSLAELCGSFVSYGAGGWAAGRRLSGSGKYLLITKAILTGPSASSPAAASTRWPSGGHCP